MIEMAIKILKLDEGWRPKAYYCTEGYPTIGYGFKCGNKGDKLPTEAMSIDNGDRRLLTLCQILDGRMSSLVPIKNIYSAQSDTRKAVLISMAYQLGISGIYDFKKMWKALGESDYKKAANEALDSLAARQAPKRWARNSYMLETGKISAYYLNQI